MAMTLEKESVGSNSTPPPPSVLSSSTSSSTSSTTTPLPSPPTTTGSIMSPENEHTPPPQQQQQQQNPRWFTPEKDNKNTCFYCEQKGHWVKDCPMKKKNKNTTSPKTPQPPSSAGHDEGLPVIHCTACGATCIVRVSGTTRNPGRKFYTCPLSSVTKCNFFKWCDSVTSDDIIDAPTCGCGAGTCRIYKETSGQNAGRRFFVCPIKKGQGACNFLKLLDARNDLVDEQLQDATLDPLDEQLPDATMDLLDAQSLDAHGLLDECTSSLESTLTNCHDPSPSNRDFMEEWDSRHRGKEIESSVVDASEHPRKLGTLSELSRKEREPLVDLQGQEDTSDEPLRKQYKRLRHGDPEIVSFTLDSISGCWDMPQLKSRNPTAEKAPRTSILTSQALNHQRQVKFLRQISSAGASLPADSSTSSYCNSSALPTTREQLTQNCLETVAIYPILGFPIKGWCGRLVFPPSRSLTFPAPKPFFCGVFPCFDPILVPQDANILDAEASTVDVHSPSSIESNKPSFMLTPCQPLGAFLWEPSSLKPPPKIIRGNIMKGSIIEVYKQAAVRLQDRLLTLLESMAFRDHECMLEESNSVFGALEGLFVDYQPFKEQVMEFISHAALLAELELSIDNDRSWQELVECHNRKKLQLEDISRRHAETSTALKVSNEHLQYLEKEATRVKDMLLQIEEELSCCEVENMEIRTRLIQISEDKLQSELNLQVAFNEVEEGQILCQQREVERNVAKAAFEKARSELRQSCNLSLLM